MNTVLSSRIGKLPLLEFVFILLCVLFYTHFEVQDRLMLIAPFAGLGYILYVFLKESSNRGILFKFILLLAFIAFLYSVLNDASSIGDVANRGLKRFFSKFSQYLILFLPAFFFYRTVKYASKKQIYIFLCIGLLSSLMVSQAALEIIELNPLLVHSMQIDVLEEAGISFTGFYYIYSYTFLVIASLILILYSRNQYIKWLAWIVLFSTIYFLYKAQFTLSLVTTAISCYYVYYKIGESQVRKLFVIVIGMLFLYLIPDILGFVVRISDSELFNERVQELIVFFNNSGHASEESDLQARLDLYWQSIQAFLHSPLWGNRYLDFDGHATFLMIWADLGLLGGIPISYLFYKTGKIEANLMGNYKIYFKALFVQMILMGLTNPIHSSPANFIMLWFICPLLIMLFAKDKKLEN